MPGKYAGMRNPGLAILLVVLALVPIAVWGYVAHGAWVSYEMSAQGSRKTGQAAAILTLILAALTPAFIGGILMAVGAYLLSRRPQGARITATVGLVLVIATVAAFLAAEGTQAGVEMIVVAASYALLHVGVLVWLWRGRLRPAV